MHILDYIKEFLCLAPHNQKFVFRETAEILHRSASTKKDFSGYRAALGFNAIGMYAANLLNQPWRKEYRQIQVCLWSIVNKAKLRVFSCIQAFTNTRLMQI